MTALLLGFTPPAVANADPCFDLLAEYDLDEITHWQSKSNDDFPLFSTSLTHTGPDAAYLAGRNDAVDRLAAAFTLPAKRTNTLRFWWQLQSEEELTFTDKLTISIVDRQGRPLHLIRELTGREHGTEWQELNFDLTPWADQSIGLHFLARTDGEAITDFFVDDITVTVCPDGTASD